MTTTPVRSSNAPPPRPSHAWRRIADTAPQPPAGSARHARRWAAGWLAALLVAGACSATDEATPATGASPTGTAEDVPLGFTPSPLQWATWAGRLQCASLELEVPLDYDDPTGPMITLALAMLPATDPDVRIGALVTNPGGPGNSGVDFLGIAVTYDDGLRDLFYAAIAEGQRGLGNLFEQFAQGFVGEFDLAPTIAVYCGDLPHPITTDQVEELATAAARDATVVPGLASGYLRAFALPCLGWPVQAPDTLRPVTATGGPPILVIGNTGDPVTPYDAARRVASTLEHGRLLTYQGDGHTTYGEAAPVLALLPVWAFVYALTLDPTTREVLTEAPRAVCHGSSNAAVTMWEDARLARRREAMVEVRSL